MAKTKRRSALLNLPGLSKNAHTTNGTSKAWTPLPAHGHGNGLPLHTIQAADLASGNLVEDLKLRTRSRGKRDGAAPVPRNLC